MKLDNRQIDQVHAVTGAQPLPDDFNAMTELLDVFGEHTFYLAEEGLLIWEWVEGPETEGQPVVAVKLARWSDDGKSGLSVQAPEVTSVIIPLDSGFGPTGIA